ncbi:uncharacterized, partial [Tachysurus ichikawai]
TLSRAAQDGGRMFANYWLPIMRTVAVDLPKSTMTAFNFHQVNSFVWFYKLDINSEENSSSCQRQLAQMQPAGNESLRRCRLDAEAAWHKPLRPCVLIHATQKKQQRKGLHRKGLELRVSTEIRACPVLVPLATSAQEEAQLYTESILVILQSFH